MTNETDTSELDNEDTVLAEAAAEDEAAKAAKAEPAAEVVAEPEPEPAAAEPDPVALAIAENAAATRALAEQVAAQRQAAEAVTEEPAPPARNYDAELKALRATFNDDESDMDMETYESQRDAIVAARMEETAQKQIADALAKQDAERQRQSEEVAEAQWQAAYARFSADPGNAAMLADPIKRAGFEAALKIEYGESPNAGWDDMLVSARSRFTGEPVIDTSKQLRDAQFQRQTAAPDPATTLRDVPSSGQQDGAPGSALDGLPISDLEDALARMPPAELERYLAEAPGGLRDNPRYAG